MSGAAQPQSESRGYAQLNFHGVSVLVPRECIARIEAIADLDLNERFGMHLMLGKQTFRSPAVTLSKDLVPAEDTPADHRFVAFLVLDGKTLGVTAESIRLLPTQRVTAEVVPDCVRLPHSPVIGLNRREGEFAFICDSAALIRACVSESTAHGN